MLRSIIWKGAVEINNQQYSSLEEARNVLDSVSDDVHVILHSVMKNAVQSVPTVSGDAVESVKSAEYCISVKKYMTEKASPGFDFMAKWNNDNPMPLRTMTGMVEKETRGMVYMKLHGQAEATIHCMRCGRLLTNPISKHYGIGPECMSKLGFVCDITDVNTIKKKLVDVVWEGWIIKSAITERTEVL